MRSFFVVFLLLFSVSVSAQEQDVMEVEPSKTPRFEDWPTSWFLASSVDFGVLYLRPRLSLGWGKPHRSWVGMDVNPTISISAPGGYAGLRLATPYVNLRVGARGLISLNRSALVPQEEYVYDDVFIRRESSLTPRSAYVSGEAELTFNVPAGPGDLTSELAATYIAFHPPNRFVFEERLRVVAEPPWIGKARLGYRFPIPIKTITLRVEPATEIIVAQGRPEPTVRTGVLLSVPLGPRLSIRGNFLATVSSPDRIGFTGMNFGEITVRWRNGWRLR